MDALYSKLTIAGSILTSVLVVITRCTVILSRGSGTLGRGASADTVLLTTSTWYVRVSSEADYSVRNIHTCGDIATRASQATAKEP